MVYRYANFKGKFKMQVGLLMHGEREMDNLVTNDTEKI